MEAAQPVLMGSPDGIALIDDEMSGFFGRIEKYAGNGAAADRSFWLKSYDGGTYMVNRVTRTASAGAIIPNISVSMLGGIQPEAVKAIAATATDDGLIQRFFPVILKSGGTGQDRPIPDVAAHHATLINALHELEADVPLRFDAEALRIREAEEAKNVQLQVIEDIYKKLGSHVGKYGGMFARLCLIWHCIEHAEAEELPSKVTGETARKVAAFLRIFLFPHALSFYADLLEEGGSQHHLTEVAKHILAHGLDVVSNADLQSNVNATRNLSKHGRIALLEMLEGMGWASELPPKRFKRSERWLVNPLVHERFKDRTADIIDQKKALKKVMSENFAIRRAQKTK